MKGLVRIRHKSGHGWQARRCVSPRETKYFADKKHGGSVRARTKAIKWLYDRARANGEPVTNRRVKRAPMANGEPPGVYRAACFGRDGWMAAWTDMEGHLNRKWFSIAKHGPSAMRLAAEWRTKAERQVHGSLMPSTRWAMDRKRLLREHHYGVPA